jgi:hypothetical protein
MRSSLQVLIADLREHLLLRYFEGRRERIGRLAISTIISKPGHASRCAA